LSLFSTSDPTSPPEPLGAAGQRTAGITAVVMADLMWLLGTYVWHGTVPEPVTWTVALVVPYAVSQAAARLVHRRATAAPVEPAAPVLPIPAPRSAESAPQTPPAPPAPPAAPGA
jgi:hypothetical protein